MAALISKNVQLQQIAWTFGKLLAFYEKHQLDRSDGNNYINLDAHGSKPAHIEII